MTNSMILDVLTTRAKRGRELKQRLYFQPFPVNSETDARTYLDLAREYNFLADLFAEMQCYGWSDEGYDFETGVSEKRKAG